MKYFTTFSVGFHNKKADSMHKIKNNGDFIYFFSFHCRRVGFLASALNTPLRTGVDIFAKVRSSDWRRTDEFTGPRRLALSLSFLNIDSLH